MSQPTSFPLSAAPVMQEPVPKSFLFVLYLLIDFINTIYESIDLLDASFQKRELILEIFDICNDFFPVFHSFHQFFLLTSYMVREGLSDEVEAKQVLILVPTDKKLIQVVSLHLFILKKVVDSVLSVPQLVSLPVD